MMPLPWSCGPEHDPPPMRRQRARWVRDHLDPRLPEPLRTAMASLPRHRFVPPDAVHLAYGDHPVPIAAGATISQPSLVARMLAALDLRAGMSVLDIGSGSGYAAALLAALVGPHGRVTAVEIHPHLVERSRVILAALGCAQVAVHPAGPILGLPDGGPYERIHMACAVPDVPDALLAQLRPDGLAIVPVGPADGEQRLLLLRHPAAGPIQDLGPVQFVPTRTGRAPPPPSCGPAPAP